MCVWLSPVMVAASTLHQFPRTFRFAFGMCRPASLLFALAALPWLSHTRVLESCDIVIVTTSLRQSDSESQVDNGRRRPATPSSCLVPQSLTVPPGSSQSSAAVEDCRLVPTSDLPSWERAAASWLAAVLVTGNQIAIWESYSEIHVTLFRGLGLRPLLKGVRPFEFE